MSDDVPSKPFRPAAPPQQAVKGATPPPRRVVSTKNWGTAPTARHALGGHNQPEENP